jgi:hypothetical protein
MIRKQMEKRRLRNEDVARKLHISIGYVNHLKYEGIAACFSPGLVAKVVKLFDLPPRKARRLAEAHNKRVDRYRKGLRAA